MGRNDIRLNQINARLGDLNKPRQRDPYAAYDSSDDEGETRKTAAYEPSPSMGVGFISTMVGLFAMVFAGVFAYGSDLNINGLLNWRMPSAPEFVSKVDSICKPMWASPGFNYDALACYILESPNRFCDDQEKQNLVSMIFKFRMDAKTEQTIELHEIVVDMPNTLKQIDQAIKDSDEGKPIKGIPSKHQIKKAKYLKNLSFSDFIGEMQKIGQNPSLMGHVGFNDQLAQLVRGLMLKGYFQPGDFGMFQDDIVKDALIEPLPEIKSPCNLTKS
jgi:hypothetical protein